MAPKAKQVAVKRPAVRQQISQARQRQAGAVKSQPQVAGKAAKEVTPSNEVIKASILSCFQKTDADGNGELSPVEFCKLFQLLGLSDSDANTVLVSIDKNQNGSIDFEEFTNWMVDETQEASEAYKRVTGFVADITAARERLEFCTQRLRKAEKDAGPIEPVELWFEKADRLGMTFGKGAENQSNLVTRALRTDVAYKKGVRENWRVTEVAGQEVADTDYVPDLLMEARLRGGVSVKFLSLEAQDRQRDAVKTLPDLQAALQQAQATLDELEQPFEKTPEDQQIASPSDTNANDEPAQQDDVLVPPPWVRVQYYQYCEPFHAPDGRLPAKDIDDLYAISDVMPGTQLILAHWREGSTHLLSFGQADSGVSPLVDMEHGVFVGLEADKMYFLIAQESEEVAKRDAEWREVQAELKEKERLSEVKRRYPHDCKKAAIPVGLDISGATGEHIQFNGRWNYVSCSYNHWIDFSGGKHRTRSERPIYRMGEIGQTFGMLMWGGSNWEIRLGEDSHGPVYTHPTDKGELPPAGEWRGKTPGSSLQVSIDREKVCRVCNDLDNLRSEWNIIDD